MKKIVISGVQFLLFSGVIGFYVISNFNKKHPLAHFVSEPKSILKYDIQYLKKDKFRLHNKIKILLTDIHDSLKSDLAQSDIYNFNNQDCTPYLLKFPYAYQILRVYKDVYFYSNGLYDPTLECFLKKIRDKDSIIQTKNLEDTNYKNLFEKSKPYIGLDYVMVNSNRLKKLKEGVCLNLDSLIRACQAKNLSEFLKSQSIKNFYFILNNEIVTNGFRDGKGKLWNVVYSVPIEVCDEENHVHNKKVKVVFKVKDKSISAFNNTNEASSLENFYVDDLKEFEKCEEEMRLFIKQCKFVFYKNPPKKNTLTPLEKILLPKLTKKNKSLFQKTLKERNKRKKAQKKNFNWGKEGLVLLKKDVFEKFLEEQGKDITVLKKEESRNSFCDILKQKKLIQIYDLCGNVCSCVFQFLSNYSDADWEKFLREQSLNKKIKVYVGPGKSDEIKKLRERIGGLCVDFLKSEEVVQSLRENCKVDVIEEVELKEERKEDVLDDFALNFVLSDKYKKYLRQNYVQEGEAGRIKKLELKNINIDRSKNILINPLDGGLVVPKFICSFVISDNPILSKCLSLSCNMNNFSNANEVFKILNKHQCEYFVLYQDEDKKLQYKSSKQLKVKIDNHRYIISL